MFSDVCSELERQQESEADRFFLELENDHFEAVNDVLSSIFSVQRSIRSVPVRGVFFYRVNSHGKRKGAIRAGKPSLIFFRLSS